MRKSKDLAVNKITVFYFQRRPRPAFSFSLEYIFDDIRERLKNKINAEIKISKFFNDGYLTKIYNIIEAGLKQGKGVNHITGEMHFLDLFMRKQKTVLTVLDCGMVDVKQGISRYIIKLLYLNWPIKRAKYVTAISEITKQGIIQYTNCPPEKITIIPVAVNPIYQPYPKVFNSKKPNILHIGSAPNKNLLRLIEALDGLDCHLTIVGKLDEVKVDKLKKHGIEYSNAVGISQQELLQKYIDCDILAFVSTSEGFGMPIVEANCIERVVLTSNISSMPEVANDAACLVDPYNVDEIRAGVIKLISDENYRNKLIENGRINKLRFDGQKIAESYYELYKKIDSEN